MTKDTQEDLTESSGEAATVAHAPRYTSYSGLAAVTHLGIGLNRILGELASWGVQQSPYTVPDKLAEAVEGFKTAWPRAEYADFETMRDMEMAIKSTFDLVPEILAWNERKNGNKSPLGFSSRYDQPNPDDDFIDLDALARNMAMAVWRDAVDFEAFNDAFDARYGRTAPGSADNAVTKSDEKNPLEGTP